MNALKLNKNNFDSAIKSEKPVLLDFYADWCGPCRMVLPIVEEIAGERDDVVVAKINVDDEPELKAKLGKRLVELIEGFGDRLQTGFVGTPYLLDALTDIGRADKAYTLLLQEKFPSWLFSVNQGATTIWEHWDSKNESGEFWSTDMNSFNHYAYGACAAWFYRDILGIKPTSPAYKTFKICPIPSEKLGFAKARIETRAGVISSEWTYETEGIRYCFSIPEGTTADVTIDGVTKTYAPGSYTVWGK